MKQYKFILNGTELSIAPAGWDNVSPHYVRNEFYWSISRSLVLNLRFPLKAGGGGLEILAAYNTYGINASMTFVIKERNSQTNDYDTQFSGILDFNPERFSINWEDRFFEIGAIDGSKEQKFFTRDEIEFDINSLISADGDTMTNYGSIVPVEFNPVNVYLNAFCTGSIIDTFTLTQGSPIEILDPVVVIVNNIIGDRISNTNPVYTNDTAFNAIVTIDLSGSYTIIYGNDPDLYQKGTTGRLMIRIYNSSGTEIFSSRYTYFTLDEANSPFTGSFNKDDADPGYSWTVPAGGWIEIKLEFTRSTTSTFPLPQPDNEVDVNLTFSHINIYEQSPGQAESDVNCITVHDALVRLIQLQTSEDTPANILYTPVFGYLNNSNFVYTVSGQHAGLCLTTGWNLRQFPGKPFNLSMRDLFKTIDVMCFLGLGYDRISDRFYVDYKTNFFKDEVMFDLGEVDELVITPYKEAYFNEVEFGYNEEVEYEELQGANEFNVPCSHLLNLPVKSKYDLKTKLNGDTIGVELARRQPYSLYPQTDTRYDEQKFIVHTNIQTLPSPSATVYQGVDRTDGFQGSDEYYNTRYTPRANLKRWAKFLKIPLFRSDQETKFIKTQKNAFVEILNDSELTGLTAANLPGEPLFFPELYEFKAPFLTAHITALNTDPHRIVQFSSRNVDYAGHLLQVNEEGYNKKAGWKLLRAVHVDKNFLFEDETLYNFESATQKEFE